MGYKYMNAFPKSRTTPNAVYKKDLLAWLLYFERVAQFIKEADLRKAVRHPCSPNIRGKNSIWAVK